MPQREEGERNMNGRVERQTVDLSAFPDLVVIYLGMRVNAWTGVKTLVGFGPQIRNSVDQKPDGLLLHENFIMSVIPLHRVSIGATLTRWKRGRARRRIATGGATSCGRRGERASGTRRTSCAVAWRQFTMMCQPAWVSDNSPPCS